MPPLPEPALPDHLVSVASLLVPGETMRRLISTRRTLARTIFGAVVLAGVSAIPSAPLKAQFDVGPDDTRHKNEQTEAVSPEILSIRIPKDASSEYCQGLRTWQEQNEYHIELLRLSVQLASPETKIEPVCMDYPTEARRVSMLQTAEQINTVFFGTNAMREEQLLPVYVPLFLGTTGLRLFMMRPGLMGALDQVQTIDDLRTYTMGQGLGWPDTEILLNNGFQAMPGRYKTLHRMLAAGRFDLYPRAYWQIVAEWNWMHQDAAGIEIHPGLALYYPQPIYFFVSPKTPELRDIIETGMMRAYANGMMFDLIKTHPDTAPSFSQISIRDLHVLQIPNATLTDRSHLALQNYGLLD
ncbi:hypothetical protein [Thalassospira australica]|uniref:hypothetical protein n=1 Tax=Thalassospira australica TaxID=1528106 RepID=UPI0012E022C4|nr:hypothetical protein [Thalassospira australica]